MGMCCQDRAYVGLFEEESNRRVVFIGVAIVEVIDKCILAGLAAIEFSLTVKELMSQHIYLLITFLILFMLSGILHCWIFDGPDLLYSQLPLAVAGKSSFILFCVSVLNKVRIEGWDSTGLLTFIFLTIAFIKFCSLLIAFLTWADMTDDWAYLIEFSIGTFAIVILVLVYQLTIKHAFLLTSIIGSVIGSFLSQISLMDLHQNMRLNQWWWEGRLMDGCVYHVIRQYTLSCCKRIEDKPSLEENTRQDQRE